jgi:hypothetical protein
MNPAKRPRKTVRTSADFSAITAVGSYSTSIDTAKLFDNFFTDTHNSPIDQFLTNTNTLNVIYLNAAPLTPMLATLVFMGYVSAVESYIRALIRGLINIDEEAQRIVEAKMVSFGAAIHHSKQLLPEALMEGTSLANPASIKSTLENLVGIILPTADLKKLLDEFNKLCHLRHCCIHRFGKLGTNNAIELGLSTHKDLLEKPINLNKDDLDKFADTLRTFVKTVNNATFRLILERTVHQKKSNKLPDDSSPMYSKVWTWDYRKDRSRFSKYYKLFVTHVDTIPSPPINEMYQRFRNALKKNK